MNPLAAANRALRPEPCFLRWVLAAALLLLLGAVVDAHAIAPDDRRLVERALADCPLTDPEADPWLLLDMLGAEDHAGLPPDLRGVTLAAACLESGYDPEAVGDCYCGEAPSVRTLPSSVCVDGAPRCRARGILQLWPHAKMDRHDPLASTWFWLASLMMQLDRVSGACPAAKGGDLLAAAWARAVRAPGPARCGEKPKAWPLLQRWSGGGL